jgi:hypothetical protein
VAPFPRLTHVVRPKGETRMAIDFTLSPEQKKVQLDARGLR